MAWTSPLVRNNLGPASLPPGTRIYAVGDIHGRADLLSRVLIGIDAHARRFPAARALTVFLGDYIDRGPASRLVLEMLLQWRREWDSVFLRGNHEDFLPRFLSDSRTLEDWRLYGGLETMLSYGLKPTITPGRNEQIALADELAAAVPRSHLDFLRSLTCRFECGDLLFVHAGIRPGVPIHRQSQDDLLWIREEFLSCEQPFDRYVVHGHSPVHRPDVRPNRMNIDTGAFATGRLTCMVIEGSAVTPLAA